MAAEEANRFFLALIAQHEFLGLVGLGKVADPATEKAEVDLQKTRIAVGTLEMLEEKTRGHLTEIEQRELRRILTILRLNYVEEAGKPSAAEAQRTEEAKEGEQEEEDEGPQEQAERT